MSESRVDQEFERLYRLYDGDRARMLFHALYEREFWRDLYIEDVIPHPDNRDGLTERGNREAKAWVGEHL